MAQALKLLIEARTVADASHFLAELAIFPFFDRDPELTLATLQRWSSDPSAHMRRLVSKGIRPRLARGLRLRALVDNPTPAPGLQRMLQDDPSACVRRSVANHLNDIANDHLALVARWVEKHLPDAPSPPRALLRHASRTLIKAGDARVLTARG